MEEYGYGRVSSLDQNLARQFMALSKMNIPKKNIYMDKQSGKDFERAEYKRLLRKLKPGDILYVKEIDRLGRNYVEIQEQWRYLTKVKKVDIVILDMPLLDTRYGKDLLGTFISDLVLQILCFVAEQERIKSKQRQYEGIIAAHKEGVKFGRPCCMSEAEFQRQHQELKDKGLEPRKIIQMMDISPSTFYRYLKKYG